MYSSICCCECGYLKEIRRGTLCTYTLQASVVRKADNAIQRADKSLSGR